MDLTGELNPVPYPAKRLGIGTVLQEIIHCAALFIHKVRQRILGFGRLWPDVRTVAEIQDWRLVPGRWP